MKKSNLFNKEVPKCHVCGENTAIGIYINNTFDHFELKDCKCAIDRKKKYSRLQRKRDLILFFIGNLYTGLGMLFTEDQSRSDYLKANLIVNSILLIWIIRHIIKSIRL